MGLVSDSKNFQATLEKSLKITSLQPKGFPDIPAKWTADWELIPSVRGDVKLFVNTLHQEPLKNSTVLFVMHGQGEHGGRYSHFPHYLADDVGAVICMDHRGHGRSEGIRGHVEKFDYYAEDAGHVLRKVYQQLAQRLGKCDMHVLGHSMGGLIALRMLYLNRDLPLSSATISAPLLGVRFKIPPIKKHSAKILAKVWGSLQLGNEVNEKLLSHDTEVQKAYVADQLVHNKVTPQFFSELQWAMADTLKNVREINVPTQFLIPLQDQIVDPERALELYHALPLRFKRLKTYSGFYHEAFNEVKKDQVFADLKEWVKSHITS